MTGKTRGSSKGTRPSRAPKSPRFKHAAQREAEKNEKKARPTAPGFDSPAEALKNFRSR